ncbi:hypothetical protein Cadr_000022182 [Camelus dromedarius]|uniref:Uncharacterized protein n=1 Tax=Camelus dromedarius TaxID=9838 RepID=A0A5N4CT77_CAMDR|nr:hypothetical protein Cadr_000022182 [Camelus dromedarius]
MNASKNPDLVLSGLSRTQRKTLLGTCSSALALVLTPAPTTHVLLPQPALPG